MVSPKTMRFLQLEIPGVLSDRIQLGGDGYRLSKSIRMFHPRVPR
jgi:hypothetical protein